VTARIAAVLLVAGCVQAPMPMSPMCPDAGQHWYDDGVSTPRCIRFCDTDTGALCELDGQPITPPDTGAHDSGVDDRPPRQVALGRAHVCILERDGTVTCEGDNSQGQLGLTDAGPVVVTGARHIAAGSDHTCARVGGTLQCWGRNAEGQAGAPVAAAVSAGTVSGLSQVRTVSAARNTTLVVLDEGRLVGFGSQQFPAISSYTPMTLTDDLSVDVTAAPDHFCSRHSDGRVDCLGYPTALAVDPSCTTATSVYARGDDAGTPLTIAAEVACAGVRACFVRMTDGRLYAWGDDRLIAPGLDGGFVYSRCGALPIDLFGPVRRVVAGQHHACVLLGQSSPSPVRCWGADDGGEVVPPAIGDVVDVFAGPDSHGTCVDDGNRVRCWNTGIPSLDVLP
jgi:hypothetical protein